MSADPETWPPEYHVREASTLAERAGEALEKERHDRSDALAALASAHAQIATAKALCRGDARDRIA